MIENYNFSVAGLRATVPLPVTLYPATKFALRAMTDTLKEEIKKNKDKIRVTVSSCLYIEFDVFLFNKTFILFKGIHPGLVKTEMQNTSEVFLDLFNTIPYLQSQDVADCVVFALSVPSHVQVRMLIVYLIDTGIFFYTSINIYIYCRLTSSLSPEFRVHEIVKSIFISL